MQNKFTVKKLNSWLFLVYLTTVKRLYYLAFEPGAR